MNEMNTLALDAVAKYRCEAVLVREEPGRRHIHKYIMQQVSSQAYVSKG